MKKYVETASFNEKVKRKIKHLLRPFFLFFYIPWLRWETFIFNFKNKKRAPEKKKKNLYFVSASAKYKHLLAKAVRTLGHDDFDYIINMYDGSKLEDEIFKKCKFMYESGLTFKFVKKYITPDFGEKYAHIFLWDDDIDVGNFSYKNFLDIFERNNLQMAQPSLTHDSYYTFKLTLQDPKSKVGRYTDFVEVMVPVIKGEYWPEYWEMIEEDYNQWGWGYDSYARSMCGYKNMGIIDQETITHTKPIRGEMVDSRGDYEKFKKKHSRFMLAKFVSYGKLK